MEDHVKKNIEKLVSIADDRQQKFSYWLKNIITIAAGLIAVLVSLKTGKSPTYLIHVVFVCTIGLLSLGILTGVLVLYHEVYLLDKARQLQQKYIQEAFGNPSADMFEWIKDAWYYKAALWICLCSFCLSIISLTLYAYLIDK